MISDLHIFFVNVHIPPDYIHTHIYCRTFLRRLRIHTYTHTHTHSHKHTRTHSHTHSHTQPKSYTKITQCIHIFFIHMFLFLNVVEYFYFQKRFSLSFYYHLFFLVVKLLEYAKCFYFTTYFISNINGTK